jgi:hypothetical protein
VSSSDTTKDGDSTGSVDRAALAALVVETAVAPPRQAKLQHTVQRPKVRKRVRRVAPRPTYSGPAVNPFQPMFNSSAVSPFQPMFNSP